MSRLVSSLAILAAFISGAFIIAFSSQLSVSPASTPVVPTASSTLSVLPGLIASSSPPSVSYSNGSKTTILAPSTTQATSSLTAEKRVPSTGPTLLTTPTPSAEPSSVSFDVSASALRSALVNILCYAPAGSPLHSISGSGVIIDPKGIILTNAHIAQYFLLADRGVSCTIRSGSPAVDRYTAKLIFIPSTWIHANVGVLTEAAPSGTGEYDFAFLAITQSVTSKPLPSSFPFMPLSTVPPLSGAPVVIASYGAQFLDPTQVESSLFPTLVFGSVKSVFTFGTNTIDVLALGGSAAAQEGSSGGGVADAEGNLVGTITTSTIKGATATRALNAITASYVRAEYASETGQPLDLFLSEQPAKAVSDFGPKIPALEAILTASLP